MHDLSRIPGLPIRSPIRSPLWRTPLNRDRATEDPDEVTALRLVVHGRVQGVFFRAGTRDRARRAGVSGWAANRVDGTVEVHLEGPPAAVAEVRDWIAAGGPRHAQVDRVEVSAVDVAGHHRFAVQPDRV